MSPHIGWYYCLVPSELQRSWRLKMWLYCIVLYIVWHWCFIMIYHSVSYHTVVLYCYSVVSYWPVCCDTLVSLYHMVFIVLSCNIVQFLYLYGILMHVVNIILLMCSLHKSIALLSILGEGSIQLRVNLVQIANLGKYWFENMGNKNKIWLIDWLIDWFIAQYCVASFVLCPEVLYSVVSHGVILNHYLSNYRWIPETLILIMITYSDEYLFD